MDAGVISAGERGGRGNGSAVSSFCSGVRPGFNNSSRRCSDVALLRRGWSRRCLERVARATMTAR
eukprot:365289-Chlamydomonas_euryale.AAC.21